MRRATLPNLTMRRNVSLRAFGRLLDAFQERARAKVAWARWGPRPNRRDDLGANRDAPSADAMDDTVLRRLDDQSDPERQIALILEALELLEEADARPIREKLADRREPGRIATADEGNASEAAEFARGAARFARRLAWVASREALGVSPTERRATGQVRFLGRSAQEVANRLRLPCEVVTHWVKESDLSTATF